MPNDIVDFALQGDSDRLGLALSTIGEGTKQSSDVKLSMTETALKAGLGKFTIIDWTSTRRNITNKYTLVFTLRPNDGAISKSEAKDVWHNILRNTLRGDDLKKLGPED